MVKVEADTPSGNSASGDIESFSNATISNETAGDSQIANPRAVLAPPLQIPPLPEKNTVSNSPLAETSIPRLPASPKTIWPPWLLLTTAAIAGSLLTGGIWAFFKGGFTNQNPQKEIMANVITSNVPAHPDQRTEPVDEKPSHQTHTKEGQPNGSVDNPLSDTNPDIPIAGSESQTPPAVHETRSKTPALQSEQKQEDPGRHISSSPPEQSDPTKLPSEPENNQNVTADANIQRTQHISLPAPSPELSTRLDLEIEKIHFEEATLGKALDLISQLTGISINIDNAALLDRGLSRNSRISFIVEKGRASDALALLLKQVDLSFIATGNQILITGTKPDQ